MDTRCAMPQHRATAIKLVAAAVAAAALVVTVPAAAAFADTPGTEPGGDTNTGNTNISIGLTTQVALGTHGVLIGVNAESDASPWNAIDGVMQDVGNELDSTTGLVRICITCRR